MRLDFRLGAAALLIATCGCKRTPELQEPERVRGPEPSTAVMTAAPEPVKPGAKCVLSIPKNSAEVALFPTEAGLREFTKASSGGNDFEMATIMQKEHAVLVDTKTACEQVAAGKDGTQVRVTSGAKANQVGWVAADWTKGE